MPIATSETKISDITLEKLPYNSGYASRTGVFLKAGPRPSGPRPTARHGPAARRPEGPAAHTVLLSSGKSTHMHRFSLGLGEQMKDGEFEFVYHFNNHFNLFFCCMLPSEKRCHSLLSSSVYNNKQKQGFK